MKLIEDHVVRTPPADVADTLREQGYAAFAGALTGDALAAINAQSGDLHVELNRNGIGPVYYKNQRFLTQALASSRAVFDLMTRSWCFDVLRAYFVDGFRLTDQRIYITESGERMQWHVDNKFDDSSQSEIPGLIFIFYLSDARDGEFQLIDGSSAWSAGTNRPDFDDRLIADRYSDRVRSLPMDAGGCVIYDTRMVHRAKPILRRGHWRKSLFFQVEKKRGGGEPILINTAFAADLTVEQQYFLGFGAPPEYSQFPPSSIETIRLRDLARLAASCLAQSPVAAIRTPLWRLTFDQRQWIKRRFRR